MGQGGLNETLDLLVASEEAVDYPDYGADFDFFAINTTECLCSELGSDEYGTAYAAYNFVIIICLIPVVSIFGLCSNILNVFIYTRPGMMDRSPSPLPLPRPITSPSFPLAAATPT